MYKNDVTRRFTGIIIAVCVTFSFDVILLHPVPQKLCKVMSTNFDNFWQIKILDKIMWGELIFTATCFSNVAVMGSLDVRLSVCP